MVHTRLGSGRARAMAVELEHRDMKLIPWGGVAALLSHSVAHAGDDPGPAELQVCPPTVGRAFCFLPLPVETTLPVHVSDGATPHFLLLFLLLFTRCGDGVECSLGTLPL